MAQSTRDIKRRIRGISSTRQITKAMELVASAKLRKARERLEKSRPYYNTVYENIQQVLKDTKNLNHPYLKARKGDRAVYIVVSADRGLAGGFNSNINRLVEDEIRNKKDKVSLVTVGLKGRDYFKRRGYNVIGEFLHITEEPSFSHAKAIGNLIMDIYEKGEVDKVYIAYTKFITTISQEAKLIRILPNDELKEGQAEKNAIIEFEPSPDEVLDYLIPKYIQSVIYGALIESSCSQQGARRTAMESATDNAEEMIDELQLSYNRARQAAITAEISEIVSGAEALK
ncbi:ATP synthase gamma chain [[Clostridium] ultunense Esp]|uniref:ATP synthase gamma chain n=1 Tax=[Clostridium] ultunense Esp TaxID=1288971 RepID=M1YVY9_9FIRM|nr:ATP synthase F1 subunit gamma [Schnuerera ultunensis]CCQ94690.1 ATP synthase gamma chain [[Clostridium] ultunense Esp]SHD76606.1 ATP synthase (subunit gamma, component F1) [[Clostridium] ultunense Esp]